jgi:hypothetical protein
MMLFYVRRSYFHRDRWIVQLAHRNGDAEGIWIPFERAETRLTSRRRKLRHGRIVESDVAKS